MAHRTPDTFFWLALLSYIAALILNALPINEKGALLLPPFGLLVLLYWAQRDLSQTHFLTAVLIGLLYDAMADTLLGLHVLLFSILLFIFLRMRLRFRLVRPLQQAGALIVLFYLYQLMRLPVLYDHLRDPLWLYYLAMPLTVLVFWPPLRFILDRLTLYTTANDE